MIHRWYHRMMIRFYERLGIFYVAAEHLDRLMVLEMDELVMHVQYPNHERKGCRLVLVNLD